MKALFVAFVLLGTLSASAKQPDLGKPWTILPAGESQALLDQCSRPSPNASEAFWSPTPAQIEELEKRLPAYLREQKHAEQADKFSEYLRQYVGFTRGGRKLIYLNAFPKKDFECSSSNAPGCQLSWRDKAVTVCDGGAAFWGVEYDPESKAFSGLGFNGFA